MITFLGSYRALIPLVIVAGLVWWAVWNRWGPLCSLATAYGGAVLLSSVLKAAVGRARPPAASAVGHFGGLAFPSGHAMQATAVWGMVAVLIVRQFRRRTLSVTAGATAALVGTSRVYLGAHWLTDVLGGWVLGAIWLVVVATVVDRVYGRPGPTSGDQAPPDRGATTPRRRRRPARPSVAGPPGTS